MKNLFLIAFFVIISGVRLSSSAQSITELSFFSPLISTFEMKYTNNHLVISQQGMKIFDITNVLNPVQVGSAAYPGSYAYQLDVNGTFAYMGEGGSGYFSVYDISNFSSPALLGSTVIPSTSFLTVGDLLVNNSTAYMTGSDSLYIIDVTIPATPVHANTIQAVNLPPFGNASSLAVNGNSLFVLNSLNIGVYDITNPLNPVLIDSIPRSHAYHNGLAVDTAGQRLFIPWLTTLQQYTGYDAYDVSNPTAPVFLFSDSTSFGGADFGVTDYYNNLLAISEFGGLHLFDVSAATHGYLTSFFGTNVPNASVSIEFRDSVFVNARRGGFEILQFIGSFPSSISALTNNESELNVYPNPAGDILKVKIPGGMKGIPLTLKMYSADSKLTANRNIESNNSDVIEINIDGFPSGIYFLQLINAEKEIIMNRKFVR